MAMIDDMEAHLWELFDELSGRRFRKFAGIDMATYRKFEAYRKGERSKRPMTQRALVDMRERLLYNLDDHERARGKGLIV